MKPDHLQVSSASGRLLCTGNYRLQKACTSMIGCVVPPAFRDTSFFLLQHDVQQQRQTAAYTNRAWCLLHLQLEMVCMQRHAVHAAACIFNLMHYCRTVCTACLLKYARCNFESSTLYCRTRCTTCLLKHMPDATSNHQRCIAGHSVLPVC